MLVIQFYQNKLFKLIIYIFKLNMVACMHNIFSLISKTTSELDKQISFSKYLW